MIKQILDELYWSDLPELLKGITEDDGLIIFPVDPNSESPFPFEKFIIPLFINALRDQVPLSKLQNFVILRESMRIELTQKREIREVLNIINLEYYKEEFVGNILSNLKQKDINLMSEFMEKQTDLAVLFKLHTLAINMWLAEEDGEDQEYLNAYRKFHGFVKSILNN